MQREIQFQFFVVKSHLQEFIFQNFYYYYSEHYSIHTLKPWYYEPRYSEFHDIVNKTQLPFWEFTTKHIYIWYKFGPWGQINGG